LTVLGTIALVGGGIVSVRAVWVGSIAVSLDSARICGASEARRSGIELDDLVSNALRPESKYTYTRVLGGSDAVGSTGDLSWVAHEDDGLDLASDGAGNSCSSAGNALVGVAATAESVITDLGTL